MNILTNLDMNKNQVLNMVLQKLATPPANPVAGQAYYDTVLKKARFYDGSKWINMDASDAQMSGESIVTAINSSTSIISDKNLSTNVNNAIAKAHNTHSITDVAGLEEALDGKVDSSRVLTDVPANAKFTDTVTTINGKTGAIKKDDIVALGIPAQDTVYTHPNSGVTAGTYRQVTVDNKGHVTGGSNPTTLAGYGITDATPSSHIGSTGTAHGLATSTVHGFMSKDDKSKLDSIEAGANKYTLPTASSTVLGGVKAGGDVNIDSSGIITVKDDSHNHVISNIDGLQAILDGKETPAGASTKASNAESNAKAYTDQRLSELLGSAPEALDTLKELADALGNDPNFATTIISKVEKKADKYVKAVGDGTNTTFSITHNLNTQDAVVSIRQSASPFAQVLTDVEMTDENTVTVKFAKAPLQNEYTVTVIG